MSQFLNNLFSYYNKIIFHYSDNLKISIYKITVERISKLKELSENVEALGSLLEDFVNLHDSKKKKINNLKNEISNLKNTINKYVDEIESLIDIE